MSIRKIMDATWKQHFLRKIKKKPFLKIVLLILFLSLALVVYQFIFLGMIYHQEGVIEVNKSFRRFPRPSDVETGQFICTPSGVRIPLRQLNDDYCDCPDGSDEPRTDACLNGKFICKSNKVRIPSGRVNDGICDCCDGSDEWNNIPPLIDLGIEIQKRTQIFYPPCPNTCSFLNDY